MLTFDYNNIELNYQPIISVLTDLAKESTCYDGFESRIKDDYSDGLFARLSKMVTMQFGKTRFSDVEDFRSWASFIDYMLENSAFLNRGLKTRNKKNFDRLAFWNSINAN